MEWILYSNVGWLYLSWKDSDTHTQIWNNTYLQFCSMQLIPQAFLYALVQNPGAARGTSQSFEQLKAFNMRNTVQTNEK